ncbi:DUF1800 domain-containing protein [Qipengyuania aurantiaca]|uniref:DUF1800 domain-containing protein n=1 Tax=Qipengyuania aurantiaca TaxID=2867233 RepID=A0ABX8ZNQ3_9SPHN|nr:DUF1800 domain-containing protein [Qipengyuania aurantiaca]QZD89197.1 DUF1800 domain-containing protein [Qipengyuania aurantiaca]
MTPLAIALNRFGLGYRRGDALPSDPRAWLVRQIEAYRPSPSEVAGRAIGAKAVRRAVEATYTFRSMRDEAEGKERSLLLKERRKAVRASVNGDIAIRARLAFATDTPFMERMVHFWANHFAVSSDKSQVPMLLAPYEFGAVRPHVNGFFVDLLKAAALHPAMLAYLDQFRSLGPSSSAAKYRTRKRQSKRGFNENLGREILELHTLGVDGGYSQNDVTELALALTGWTIEGIPYADKAVPQGRGASFFDWFHQPGQRIVLGRRYIDNGAGQAIAILEDLARHPSTALFVAEKLARHFAGDAPPKALVERLSSTFTKTDGHLPSVYLSLIDSQECWEPGPVKFRQPWEWAIAMLRAGGEVSQIDGNFAGMMRALGQEVWKPRSPAGWDDREGGWAAPSSLLRRVEAAERFAAEMRLEDTRALAEAMFPGSLSESTMQTIRWAESNEMGFALLLVSPEMMRR